MFAATLDLFGRVTKHVDIWGTRAAETDYEGCKWAEVSVLLYVCMCSCVFLGWGVGGGELYLEEGNPCFYVMLFDPKITSDGVAQSTHQK